MIRLRHKILIQVFRLFDLLVPAICLALVVDILPRIAGSESADGLFDMAIPLVDAVGILLVLLGWLITFDRFVRYSTNRFRTLLSQILDVLKANAIAAFWLLIVCVLFSFRRVTALDIVLVWLIASFIGLLSRVAIRRLLTVARKSGYNYRHLLIIGTEARALELAARIEAHPELGYRIVGFISEETKETLRPGVPLPGGHPTWRTIGSIAGLQTILEQTTVDEMLLCLPMEARFPQVAQIIRLGRELGVVVRIMPEKEYADALKKMQIEFFDGECVVTFFREQLLLQLLVKRVIDIIVSATVLLVLSPLLLAVAIAIKLNTPGPVFFVQERIGMNKRRFRLYKFRSMVADAEKRKAELAHLNEMDGPVFKISDDPRITPVGRFIRKTSIDEFPQLINVLRGEMSLVGPRPPLETEVDQYEWLFRRRLSIKPGLTCLWQISGRNEVSFEEWMALDKRYIETWSLALDLKILLKTIPVVLLGKGAS